MQYTKIEVIVSGAVERSGRARLEPGATVATALRAAGGLAFRDDAVPAGDLLLRRRLPTSRTTSVYRWSIFESSQTSWRSFELQPRDVLVFGWSVRGDSA